MKIIFGCLLLVFAGLVFAYFALRLYLRNKKAEKEAKRDNKEYFLNLIRWDSYWGKLVLIPLGGMFLINIWAIIVKQNPFFVEKDGLEAFVGAHIFCYSLTLPAACIVLNWKIEVKDDYFIYTNMFGIRKKIRYEGIYSKALSGVYRYYKEGRKLPIFNISYLQNNCDRLEEKLIEYNSRQK